MKKFRLNAIPLQATIYRDAGVGKALCFGAGSWDHDRIVEAANLKELQPIFDSYCKEIEATGKPFQCSVRLASERDRKPPGFDKARDQGGPLCRDVNWAVAMEKAKAEFAARHGLAVAA